MLSINTLSSYETKLPLVSVIMPAYNAEKYISFSIESVISQTYPNIELLVIDDGSTDDTKLIAQTYVEKNKNRVTYIFQENAGPAKARNNGIESAKGEWVSFLDSNDYWIKDHVQLMMDKALSDEEIDLVYGSKIWVDQNGNDWPAELQPNYDMPEGWIFAEMFKNNLMSTPSVLVRRKKLLDLGSFNESQTLRVAEDYDLWLRITASSKVGSLPELKFFCRRHDTNTTLNSEIRARGLITAIENAACLIQDKKVDGDNDIKNINVRKRFFELYEHAVLTTYYSRKFAAMRGFILEGISKGIITRNILEKAVLSTLPERLLLKLKSLIKGK